MRADEVGVVDEHVVDAHSGLHLGLKLLDDVALLNEVVHNPDSGEFVKGFRQRLGLVHMGVNGLGNNLDGHALKGLRRTAKPVEFLPLLLAGKAAGLEFVQPLVHRCAGVLGRTTGKQQQNGYPPE